MYRIFAFLLFTFLAACSKHKDDTLRIGVTNGPHAAIAEFVQKKAEEAGMKIKLVAFDDFIQPNTALDHGDIDINIYQHEPFLNEQITSRGYKFVIVGQTILLPLGIYGADHVHSLKDVKNGAKVLISSDPSNAARSLKLLEHAGLLTLSNHSQPTLKDIAQNPLALKIIEVEAPLIPRLLKDDADIAVIIADWAMVSGMDPTKALLKETASHSPYINVIVARQGDEKRAEIQQFVKLYQSSDVKEFIAKTFHGAILTPW